MKLAGLFFVCVFLSTWACAQIKFCDEEVPVSTIEVREKLLSIVKKNIKNGGLNGRYVQERINKYLPYISSVLSRYHLPDDLKYVALAESRLKVEAISRVGASGPWQFMPVTAKEMGLVISSDVDERNNIIKSTHAACRLLSTLYRQFGSWTVAAAAYNAGPGRISSAIKKQGTNNYYTMRLNAETAAYVYEILAMKFLHGLMVKNKFLPAYQKEVQSYQKDRATFEKSLTAEENRKDAEIEIVSTPITAEGWKPGGWGQTELVMTYEQYGDKTIADSILVDATLIGSEYVKRDGVVHFRITSPILVGDYVIEKNTLIKGLLYPEKDRIGVDIAGIDIDQKLKEYNVKVFDLDQNMGLNINTGKNRIFIGDSYKVRLCFVKE